jgi:hypothetical protein
MKFSDLIGIFSTVLRLGGKSADAASIAADGGHIRARDAEDTADVDIIAAQFRGTGDLVELNTEAGETGDDWKYGLRRPGTGMTENLELVLPDSKGAAGYALVTDGDGNLSWQSSAAATNLEATDTTTIAFGSGATVPMFDLPAGAIILKTKVIVDTPFDGAPSLSIGVSGTPSKYMPATYIDLTEAAGTIFESEPGLPAEGSLQSLIASYSAGGATVGSGRILVSYVIPS